MLMVEKANAGDSRTVLSVKGRAKPLSFDHKPDNEGLFGYFLQTLLRQMTDFPKFQNLRRGGQNMCRWWISRLWAS